MASDDDNRSPELDEVRRMLFPQLSPEEGWARIEAALDKASKKRSDDLSQDLLDHLRRDDPEDDGVDRGDD